MGAASAAEVRAVLKRLLPSIDLDTATERLVRDMVAQEVGKPVDAHKKLIKDEIEAYLTSTIEEEAATTIDTSRQRDADYMPTATEQAAADDDDYTADGESASDDDDDSDFTDSEDGEGAGAGGKRKRGAAAGGRGGAAGKRKRGANGAAAAGPGGQSWRLGGGRKFARVENWKGSWRVDLREFYEKDGALLPGAKGIALSPYEWGVLAAGLPAVGAAVHGRDTGYTLQLGESRRVSVGEFRGTMLVQVREYYQTPAGQWAPGKKGVALSPDALKDLASAADAITAALPAGSTDAPPPQAAAAAAGGRGAAAAVAAGGGGAAAAAAGGGGGAAAAAGAGSFVDLGGRKRARINVYKGTKYVDLREMYEKNGEMLPGKKGISLTEADWVAVKGAMAAATAAAERRDLSFSVQLGGKRKLALSEFKGTMYVGAREYYEKDGKELPGAKGLSMTVDQWRQLVQGAPALDALFASAGLDE